MLVALLDCMGCITLTPWLHSWHWCICLACLSWFDLRSLPVFALPCFALPVCLDSFLYFVRLFLSDGMIVISSPKCELVVSLCCFFRARRKGHTSPLVLARDPG